MGNFIDKLSELEKGFHSPIGSMESDSAFSDIPFLLKSCREMYMAMTDCNCGICYPTIQKLLSRLDGESQ